MSSKSLSDATLAYAEELTDAILGLDRLYREESGDETGLAVLDISDGRSPETFEDYGGAEQRFSTLRERAGSLSEPDRSTYYTQFCESMLAFVEWRTDGLDFTEQVERFLHVPAEPPSTGELDGLQDELGTVLAGLGYDGTVAEQCSAWKDDTTVESSRAARFLASEMDEMRSETLSTLSLPDDAIERMDASGISDAPFNAKCDFADRTVVINTDPQLTRPWLRKLAVHEGYPGHVLQFSLRKHWYDEGTAPADGLLSVVNCASSATFEGIADSGLSLLESGTASDDAAALVSRYQTGIATVGAWRYHANGWSESRLEEWLSDRAIYGDDGWVKNRVKFITAPERATLMWSYWHGEPAVRDVMEKVDRSERPEFVEFLYGRMHSPESLAEFHN
jgi:hypothetical protein